MVRLSLTSLFAACLVLAAGCPGSAFAETPEAPPEIIPPQITTKETKESPVNGTVLDEVALEDGELDNTLPSTQQESSGESSEDDASGATEAQAEPASLQPMSKQLMINTTKIGLPLEQVGNSVTVITRPQIEQRQATSLLEVLRGVPGVDIVQNGSFGSTSSIFMRGLNSEHTLIMIDGVRLNDPISPGRSFNYLDQISPDAVERVEVMRGPQGPLYGTDGMGGVINIITRRGEGKPTLYAKLSAGSFGTLQQDYGASGHIGEKLRSFVHMTRQDTRGFSSAGSRYGNRELDGYHNTTLMGRVEYQPFKNWLMDLATNFTQARFDLDNEGGFGNDDPNNTSKNRIFTISGGSRLKLFNDKVEQITRLSLTDSRRSTNNDVDIDNPFDKLDSLYRGKLLALDVQNNFYLHRTNTLTAGLNMQHEWGNSIYNSSSMFGPFISEFSNRSATTTAFYAQDHIQLWNRWFTTLGMRVDHHNRFGNYPTYRAASTYIVRKTGTSFRASFGTGFKAPTISQMFGPFGANPDLKPETSTGWDAGIEQSLFDNRVQLGTTVFQNHVKDLIQYSSLSRGYDNIAKARMQGMEAFVASQPFRNLQLRASYTYTDTKDLSIGGADSGDPLLRRPRNKFSVNMNYQPHRKVNINLDITHIGQRLDKDFNMFPAAQVKLAAFTLVNLAVSYDVTKNINVFGKLVNILDTPYEMVKGYGTPRISAYGGLRLAL